MLSGQSLVELSRYELRDLGAACVAYHDAHVRGLKSRRVQCDEIWSFVGAKEKNATPEQKAEAYALRGAQQKDDERKLADMTKAIELQPKKPDYLRLRAQQLYEKEKYKDALVDTDNALKMEPEHAATNELRGIILLGLDKYDDALKSFDKRSDASFNLDDRDREQRGPLQER